MKAIQDYIEKSKGIQRMLTVFFALKMIVSIISTIIIIAVIAFAIRGFSNGTFMTPSQMQEKSNAMAEEMQSQFEADRAEALAEFEAREDASYDEFCAKRDASQAAFEEAKEEASKKFEEEINAMENWFYQNTNG